MKKQKNQDTKQKKFLQKFLQKSSRAQRAGAPPTKMKKKEESGHQAKKKFSKK
jgi:hypothetical protein